MFNRVWMVLKRHNIKQNICPQDIGALRQGLSTDCVALPEGCDAWPEEIVLYSGLEKRVFFKSGYDESQGVRYRCDKYNII